MDTEIQINGDCFNLDIAIEKSVGFRALELYQGSTNAVLLDKDQKEQAIKLLNLIAESYNVIYPHVDDYAEKQVVLAAIELVKTLDFYGITVWVG